MVPRFGGRRGVASRPLSQQNDIFESEVPNPPTSASKLRAAQHRAAATCISAHRSRCGVAFFSLPPHADARRDRMGQDRTGQDRVELGRAPDRDRNRVSCSSRDAILHFACQPNNLTTQTQPVLGIKTYPPPCQSSLIHPPKRKHQNTATNPVQRNNRGKKTTQQFQPKNSNEMDPCLLPDRTRTQRHLQNTDRAPMVAPTAENYTTLDEAQCMTSREGSRGEIGVSQEQKWAAMRHVCQIPIRAHLVCAPCCV